MTDNWMKTLSQHYDQVQEWYPKEKLMILFDIDGTIIDLQYLLYNALRLFDQVHDSHYFYRMVPEDVTVTESELDVLLKEWEVPSKKRKKFHTWYATYRVSSQAISRPLKGSIEVIRWFQMQPNVEVGFKSSSSLLYKKNIFDMLNTFGEKWLIQIPEELVFFSGKKFDETTIKTCIKHFLKLGYKLFAIIDNEPDVLEIVSKIKGSRDILCLHANTIFSSKSFRTPSKATQGKEYDLTELISEKDLPPNIQLVWHGINDEDNLYQFLINPNICWGEVDVQVIMDDGSLVINHDPIGKDTLLDSSKKQMILAPVVASFQEKNKSIKLDLKSGGATLDKVLERIASSNFQEHELWFNGSIEVLKEEGFRLISDEHPQSILQCPIDFLTPIMSAMPDKAQEILQEFTSWGINRFSLSWQQDDHLKPLKSIQEWGYEVNIYGVRDLAEFLQAILLTPRSITSDFNFPKWHYFGKGSGAHGIKAKYSMQLVQEKDEDAN